MKTSAFLSLGLLAASLSLSSQAQETKAAPTPAPGGRGRGGGGNAPVRSAEIAEDRKVTFRLRAPKATEVVVSGQWANGRAAMTKATNGVWSVTVGPVEPGVWEYSFNVDGVGMIDPANPAMKPMREPRTSILHVTGATPMIWDFQDVAHGTVRQHTYQSKSLGRLRELVVYTPPGYDKGSSKFPTLYLQHGSGDNQATWVAHGKAHWIFDNLIAQKKMVPMVVVMMDGHAAIAGGQGAADAFEKDLMQDVMPFVEASYRVKSGSANRGIVGLSMGGGQSLGIGLKHPDKFAWVGGFSSAVPNNDAVASALSAPDTTNKRLKLLWIACGKDDFLLARNEQFIATLKEKGVRHDWVKTDGAHTWPVWRDYLAAFAPKIFK